MENFPSDSKNTMYDLRPLETWKRRKSFICSMKDDILNFMRRILAPTRELVGNGFEKFGNFVAKYPYPFLVAPVIITMLLTTGFIFATLEDDIRFLYSPKQAEARREYRIHQEFSGEDKKSTYLALAVEASDHSKNLLTQERTDLITGLNDFVLNNLTFPLRGKKYHFGRDVCPKLSFCPKSNQVLEKFLVVYWNRSLTENPRVTLNYPVMKIFESKFFLPGYLYGVRTDPDSGRIMAARMVHLTYPIPSTESFTAEDVAGAFEGSLMDYLKRQTTAAKLDISVFSLHILKHELAKNTYYTLPYLSLSVILLVSFTVGSCISSNPVTSKPLEALVGVTSSGMAVLSAAGLLFYCGVPFITQVVVMPFIALAIGVDDTYIILGAWKRTDRQLSPEKRLGLALKEAGSAITVTSLTDCLSFGVGSFSQTPAIEIFCKFTAAAIFFDFIYQLTFFAAAVSLGGMREASGRHAIFFWRTVTPKNDGQDGRKEIKKGSSDCPVQRFFGTHYARLIKFAPFRIFILALYVGYLGGSIYGCSILEANLTPSKLLVDDSPMKHYLELAESNMWAEGLVGRVYVNKAPDFTKGKQEVQKFLNFVRELETTPYSIGTNSTQLWLREFLNFWQFFWQNHTRFYEDVANYVQVEFNSQWDAYLRWGSRNRSGLFRPFVDKFYFTTAFQIQNWRHRTDLLLAWREVTAKYSEYDAVVYDENNFYSDQVLALPQTAMRAMGIALLFMAFICCLFIADMTIVFWVCLSLISMDIGIIGFLAIWGADLSPTTILNIIMSIGLSVDFATHVGYRFYRTTEGTLDERMSATLASIAWPVLQGGISTFLAVFSLNFVKSYVVKVFFKTILLVVSLGLFHGLVLLPVVLRTFRWHSDQPRKRLIAQRQQTINSNYTVPSISDCRSHTRKLNYKFDPSFASEFSPHSYKSRMRRSSEQILPNISLSTPQYYAYYNSGYFSRSDHNTATLYSVQ